MEGSCVTPYTINKFANILKDFEGLKSPARDQQMLLTVRAECAFHAYNQSA